MQRSLLCVSMALVASAGAAGCGSSKPMPTADQKAALQAVESSESRAQTAIPVTASIAPSGPVSSSALVIRRVIPLALAGNIRELYRVFTRVTFTNADEDEARVEMSKRVTDAVDDGSCVSKVTGLDGATSGQVNPMNLPSGSLEVSGSKCPVTFKLNLTSLKAGEGNVAIAFSIAYSVSDDSYRKLNDVDSLTLSLTFDVKASASSGTIDAAYDMQAHSQKYGKVGEIAKGSGQASSEGGSFDLDVTDTFPAFEIQRGIKATVSGDGSKSYTYSVNGNEVTQDMFDSYGFVTISDAPTVNF